MSSIPSPHIVITIDGKEVYNSGNIQSVAELDQFVREDNPQRGNEYYYHNGNTFVKDVLTGIFLGSMHDTAQYFFGNNTKRFAVYNLHAVSE